MQRKIFGLTNQRLVGSEVQCRKSQTLVHISSIMAEAYSFGLPGSQKPLIIENYGILNTRNVLTRRIATLGT